MLLSAVAAILLLAVSLTAAQSSSLALYPGPANFGDCVGIWESSVLDIAENAFNVVTCPPGYTSENSYARLSFTGNHLSDECNYTDLGAYSNAWIMMGVSCASTQSEQWAPHLDMTGQYVPCGTLFSLVPKGGCFTLSSSTTAQYMVEIACRNFTSSPATTAVSATASAASSVGSTTGDSSSSTNTVSTTGDSTSASVSTSSFSSSSSSDDSTTIAATTATESATTGKHVHGGGNTKKWLGVAIGGGVGALLVVAVLVGVIVFLVRKNNKGYKAIN